MSIQCPKCKTDEVSTDNDNQLLFGECYTCKYMFCTNCSQDYHGHTECEIVSEPNQIEKAFDNLSLYAVGTFECQICFDHKSFKDLADLGCNHQNCQRCVKSFYETLIKESTVHNFKCPSGETCGVVITPNIIKKIVDPQVFQKYDDFLLDEALQEIPEIINCPKLNCGKRILSDPELVYGFCEFCDYRFCTNCLKAYHGVAECSDQTEEERIALIKKHLTADRAERERLELLERVRHRLEIEKNDQFVRKYSKKCPKCRANIEKISGCNHMTCRCNTHFCWLCLQILNPNEIQAHFGRACNFFEVPDE